MKASRMRRGIIPLLLASLPMAGCAAEAASGSGKGYGLELPSIQEAIERGEGREALAFYEREATALERSGRKLEAAKTLRAAAFVAPRVGAYQRGIRAALRGLELLKQEPQTQETVSLQVSVYASLGSAYRRVGDLREARRYLQEGLDLAKSFQSLRRSLIWIGSLSRNLAGVAYAQGDYTVALQQGMESIRFLEDRLRTTQPGRVRHNTRRHLAQACILVANIQRHQGSLPEAETYSLRALEIAKELHLQEIEAQAIAGLGWVALARKNYQQALERFQSALTLAARLDRVPQLIDLENGIGRTYAEHGRHEEALAAFARSLALVEDVRSELQEAGLRSGFLEDKQLIYHRAVRSALALGKPAEAFGYAERGRARAFLDLLGNQAVLSGGKTRALVEEEVRLRMRLHEASATAEDELDEGGLAASRAKAEAAQRAYREFLDRVRKENLEQASLMTVEPVTLQEVQNLLPEGTTLLEYLVTSGEVALWVIERNRVEVVRLPVPRRDLVGRVREFRKTMTPQTGIEEVQIKARALYDRLLAPARPLIRGDRLLIVPHDVLHYLPWGALRSPKGKWLVQDFTLATLPSASVLKFLQGKGGEASDAVLAVGNPDLGPALNLRYAEREARAVGERFPGATVLLQQEATKLKVKALSEQAGLLHFATHGELNEQDPLSSALLLVPEGPEGGRLEVRELFGLDLHARLVVLSACETGLGQLSRGDELVGLQRAFLYAGTPAVVTTLWKVDDRASFLLMRAFYDQLTQGRGPAEALRRAQDATMREFPHPFAWAAFGLTGAPR